MFKTIVRPLLNFLFPVPDIVNSFESDPEHFLRTLPLAKPCKNCTCLFAYQDDVVKQLIWEIKYYKNLKVADSVGKILAQKILEKTNANESYILVPIPQTSKRLNERGFNHTKLIADAVLKYLPSHFSCSDSILRKIRNTPKQNSIENRADRFKNIEGAFSVIDPYPFTNKNIIIIDDVVTTGATIGEAHRVLTQSQPHQILSFALAH